VQRAVPFIEDDPPSSEIIERG